MTKSFLSSVSLQYNDAMTEFGPWDDKNHIITGLFLGIIPHVLLSNDTDSASREIMNFITEINPYRPLGLVVSIVEEEEIMGDRFKGVTTVKPDDWRAKGVDHHLMSMADFTASAVVEDSIETLKKIHKCIEEGKAVYIHCKAGRARSAMFCVAYMCLYLDNSETGKKYDIEEALAVLKNARKQVSVGQDKQETARQIIAEARNNPEKYGLYDKVDLDQSQSHILVDKIAESKELKNIVLKSNEIKQLVEYRDQANRSHLFKTASRAVHINKIIDLINKPNSEEWYYALLYKKGPFKDLINSNPAYADSGDKDQRVSLLDNLSKMTSDELERMVRTHNQPSRMIESTEYRSALVGEQQK